MREGFLGVMALAATCVAIAPARAQEEEAEPVESPAPAVAVLPANAPLDAFVAQRRAIEEGEGGGQRVVFALPAIGALVEGAAGFLLDRAQAEVESFGAQVLSDSLCTVEQIRALVPTACEVLATWDEGGVARANLDTLVAALRTDLESMPPRLIRIALAAAPSASEEARLGLASLSVLVEAIVVGVEPAEIADRLFHLALSCDVTAEGSREVVECRSPGGQLAQRQLLRRANLMLWAFGNPVEDVNGVAIVGEVPSDRAPRVRRSLRRLLSTLRDWQRTVRWLQDPDAEADAERRREVAANLARLTVDLVFAADDAVRASSADPPSQRSRDETRTAVVSLVTAATSSDPSAALVEVLKVLRAGSKWAGEIEADVEVPSSVLRALGAASALASARDADSVRAVLDNLSAPIASWRSKREGFVLSVTGLIGINASYDLLAQNGDFSTLGDLSTAGFGVQLAVGVDFNLVGGSAGTFGFYVQAIDLGALVSLPIAGDTDRVEFEIDPLSLISPGVFLRFGLFETPLVLSFGGAFVPHARTSDTTDAMGNAVENTFDALRLSVTLSVDTTIWIF
jgi:hypothetical protein